MTKEIQQFKPSKAEKSMKRYETYLQFIYWIALPYPEKVKLGLETQEQFAEYHSVEQGTLSRWKNKPDFEKRVDTTLKIWAAEKTPDVVHSVYRSAVKGNPISQSLWLGYFKGYNPRKGEGDGKVEKVEISENDFRFIVEGLPEPMRTKYHGYLTEIIDSAYAIASARDSEDDVWGDHKPQDEIQDGPDSDAQSISDVRANDVAYCYTDCVSEDLEWSASQNNYQSTARGRKE